MNKLKMIKNTRKILDNKKIKNIKRKINKLIKVTTDKIIRISSLKDSKIKKIMVLRAKGHTTIIKEIRKNIQQNKQNKNNLKPQKRIHPKNPMQITLIRT